MNNLSKKTKIANCKCCLLSQAMKDCKVCPFNIGLVYKGLETVKKKDIAYPIELKQVTLSSLKLSID